ncbi:C1q domain-containing protein [Dyadobacter koreensis]|uniref:C1q domain-containing protein n=1 Tax=Dyadobacter koreensis TaxID=408657 RepID=A0A1H7AU12_9BACT|nr:hypothetical protein [Dyadobacter koreensis]SEJ69093.1 C1q domain-containing protein [Dyadobacter koreensis]
MIQKPLQLLKTALFTTALLFGTSTAFAQVKVGTNPTVIDPANNLEVESSTAGNKVSINKTTGKVTIADGTQASGNIFTSDANGVGSWLPNIPTAVVATSVINDHMVLQAGALTTLLFPNVTLNRGGNFNVSTSVFTAPSPGLYLASASVTFLPINVTNQIGIYLYKGSTSAQVLYQNGNAIPNTFHLGSGSFMIFLNQGETLSFRANSNVTMSVDANCSIVKLSN